MSNENLKNYFLRKLELLAINRSQYLKVCHDLKQDLSALESIPYDLERYIDFLIMELERHCYYESEGFEDNISEILEQLKQAINEIN